MKQLRMVCELEDKEVKDAGVQGLHLTTILPKKALKVADDFVDD
jgi:hypothetical protein